MHTNYPRALALVAALALTAAAFATEKPPKRPTSPPSRVAVVDADASADAAADADARAASDSTSGAAAEAAAAQRQRASSSSGGNAFSTSNDVLALDLPGHAGATEVVTDCTVSRGSLGALGIGSGGRVKIDEACAAHVRCLENVATLERLGQRPLAVQLAARCAGLELPAGYVLELAPPATARPDPAYVTREEFERAWAELVAK